MLCQFHYDACLFCLLFIYHHVVTVHMFSKSYYFKVVAREVDTSERWSSTATVTLHIIDINDNIPVFNQQNYFFSVAENSPNGYIVGQISVSLNSNTCHSNAI